MATLLLRTASPKDHSWMGRHNAAIIRPLDNEAPIVSLIFAIEGYVSQAEDWNGCEEGEWRDYVLGAGVGTMLDGFRVLLNGDLGRLDGGTLDAWVCDIAARIGYDTDTSEWVGDLGRWNGGS